MSAAECDPVPDPPGLIWGVKASFREYVAASPGGQVEAQDGAEQRSDGTLFFPLEKDTVQELEGVREFAFRGSVTFAAHDGFLSVTLADPLVHVDGGCWARLWIRRPGRPTGAPSDYQVIEESQLSGGHGKDEVLDVPEPLLCVNAVTLFDNVYPYRTVLDPLRIVGVPAGTPHP